MTIQIYEAEQLDGLASEISKASVSYASAIVDKSLITSVDKQAIYAKLASADKALAAANPNQVDLFYKNSILASVGWNKNDDVFDIKETWNARHTVIDKQMNLRHNELDIVGHMTSSFVLGEDGNVLDDSLDVDALPSRFDVVSEFVLYRMWTDEDRRQEMDKIIAEIQEGKWFVSMECRFLNFDYAVIDRDGTHKVIARTQDTAFLTKHLRIFGGTGEYQGRKIGRLLRDFFFCGQGIVEHPANERSIIFDSGSSTPFISQNSEAELLQTTSSVITKEQIMELEQLKAQLEAAEATIKALTAEKAAFQENEIKSAQATLKSMEETLTDTVAKITEKDAAIAALTLELEASKSTVATLQTEIETQKSQAVKQGRISKLVSAGVEQEQVEVELAKWAGLSEAQFDSIVAMYPKKDKAKDEKKDGDMAKCTVVPDITKASVETNVTLVQAPEPENKGVASLVSHLMSNLPYSAKASKRQ